MAPLLLALALHLQASSGPFYSSIAWTPLGIAATEAFGPVRFKGPSSPPLAVLGGARAIEWNAKGRFLAVLGGRELRLVALPSRRTIRTLSLSLSGEPFALALDASGSRAIVGTNGGDAVLLDLDRGLPLGKIRFPLGLWSFDFSPDGKQIAAGSGQGVGIVDVSARRIVRSYDTLGPRRNVYAVQYSLRGTLVAALGDGTIRTLRQDRLQPFGERGGGQAVGLAFMDADTIAVAYDTTYEEADRSTQVVAFFSLGKRRRLSRAALPGRPIALARHEGAAYVLLADGRIETHRPPKTRPSSSRSPHR